MSDCIFCEIASGKIPSEKIYEDKNVFAFLDATPAVDGHILIVPKLHFKDVLETPDKILKDIISVSKNIGKMFEKNFGADGFNIFNNTGESAGQKIFHVHFHVVPRFENDGRVLHIDGERKVSDNLKEIAKKIRGEK